jgi:hypothetical protein
MLFTGKVCNGIIIPVVDGIKERKQCSAIPSLRNAAWPILYIQTLHPRVCIERGREEIRMRYQTSKLKEWRPSSVYESPGVVSQRR